ncbi:MAG: YraN family protein [Candidatus Acidiferrales bacterium]
MSLFARAMFSLVNRFAARRGFSSDRAGDETEEGRARRRAGLRGETFAYWYLRRHGYTIVARNYRLPHPHGEIDLIGWDGDVLAFVEVKTRTTETGGPPEQGVHAAKQEAVARIAHSYLARRARRKHEETDDVPPHRFDVLAIEAKAGAAPTVRLHKGAFHS